MADSFVPPQAVRDTARRGLDLRKEWGRGGLSNAEASEQGIGSGVQRATNLANGDAVSLDTIQRMANFFSRHEKNRGAGEKEGDGGPTAGYIAWQLWGGDAGRTWANRILREQDEGMKAGNRNNRSDRQRIRDMRKAAQSIVSTSMELEPNETDEAPTVPDYVDRTAKAGMDAPNYRSADGDKSCGMCKAYSDGMCKAHDFATGDDMVCDDYADGEGEGGVTVEIEVSGAAKGFDLDATGSQPLIIGMVRAIKSDGEWALEVLGVPFGGPNGGKDSDGEYFSQKTNIYAKQYATVPAVYYHGYDETGHPSSEPQFIGMAKYDRTDSKGHWFKVILDKANDYAQRVWNAAKQGIARASSGSITHLVRKERDGHITHWPVAELSIFDAVGKRQPANQYAVALPVLKSVYAQAGLTLPDDIFTDSAQTPEDAAIGGDRTSSQGRASAKANGTDTQQDISTGVTKMEQNQIAELVAQSVNVAFAQRDAAAKAEADRQAEITNAAKSAADAAVKATREAMQAELDAAKSAADAAKAEAAEARRLPGGAPAVSKFNNVYKFDGLDIDDMAFAIGVLTAAKGGRFGDSEARGASEDLRKALAIRLAETDDNRTDGQYAAAKSAMKSAGMAMKADELNRSTLASFGDEWVSVAYSTQLWDKVRLATPIAANIPTVEIPQGSESIVIPISGNSPTFYRMAQAADQAANPGRVTPTVVTSRLGTANRTLTAAKLGAAINYTGELEEDSFIPWVAELRRDLVAEAAEVMEHVIIDGDIDLTATTNINHIGGTPAGTEAYTLFDGFRKLALVTNTANSRSAGTLTVEDYLETLKLLGVGGRNAADKSKVAFITDMWTHWKSMELAEVKTRDVFVSPTIENGMLTSLYGARVIASPNMHRANQNATWALRADTTGKVNLTTASNNTTGSILAVRFDQWRLGYKRRWAFEVQRDAISDSTVIVGTMRVGMVYRDTEAAGISFNVTL
jgi:hypothetical protein